MGEHGGLYAKLSVAKEETSRDCYVSAGAREEQTLEEWSDGEGSFVSSVESDDGVCLKLFGGGERHKNQHLMVSRCTKCGERFKGDAVYCGECGASREVVSSPMEVLRKDLEVVHQQQVDLRRRFEEAKHGWNQKEGHFQNLLQSQADEARRLEDAIERLQTHTIEGPKPPGPRSLRFVEGNVFTCISSTVIVLNVLTLVYQTMHSGVGGFRLINTCFLAFYTVELLLKMLLWQNMFLCGPRHLLLWHLLDLIIVVGGLLDTIILPLVASGSHLQMLSALRMLRLARLLKLCHNFVVVDTSWADAEWFQIFIMSLIALSSLIMGLECDWPELTHFLDTIYWEQVILVVFTFEVAVRMKNSGIRFFWDPHDWMWNWLDFSVVAGGVIDQWMIPGAAVIKSLITGEPVQRSGNIGDLMVLLRMVRLLRILRLVRLVRQVPQLFTLLSGIAKAMAGMVWVLALTIVVLYFFALLAVKLFRDGLAYDGSAPEDVQELFNSVPDSIFVLFTVMDGHKSILDPLLNSLPSTKVVFMIFVMVSEWAMLSILTAVVSENMITVTEARKVEAEAVEQFDKEMEKADELDQLFTAIDLNQDGTINLLEFDAMLKDPATREALCEASNLSATDLRLMFNILERNGEVKRKQFIEACGYENKAVSERSLMKLEKRLAGVEEKISTTIVTVEGAGLQSCNGTYEESGVHNLKPLYRKMDKSGAIIYFDFFWKLNDTPDTSTWRYAMDSKSEPHMGLHLHSAQWKAMDESCGSSPKVGWESHHILDKRIEILEGMVLETHRDVHRLTARLLGGVAPK